MQRSVSREEIITDAIFCGLGSLLYIANIAHSWHRFKLRLSGATQSWYRNKDCLNAVALASTFLFGNIACSSWIGIAHSRGLSDVVPGILWKLTFAICFAVSEMIILYAVSDQVPWRQLAGPCVMFLQALWVAFGIWKWRSGAVWAFPAMTHGSFAVILLYQISNRQFDSSLPPPPRSDYVRLLLRTSITAASLGMGFYSFAKGPVRCHFSIQCSFSLFEVVQSTVYAEMRLIKDRSASKRARAVSNRRRSSNWVNDQSQQSLVSD